MKEGFLLKYALIFPGQGAQEVGMGRDLYDKYAAAREVFDEADDVLGYKLSELIFEGPESELMKTANTQPAIMTASIAVLRSAESDLGRTLSPLMTAGHSLGEYSALVASGVLKLSDALPLVSERGRLMQDAVPLGAGAMLAVLGLDLDAVKAVCEEAADGEICSPANVNAPAQIVISGHSAAVGRAGVIAKEKGASKVIPLKVSAPFHCELMRPVADKLKAAFEKCVWSAPLFPVVANVDASFMNDVDSIKKAAYAQTFSPVLWAQDALAMESGGAEAFVEMGPGNVLSGLVKRICKGKKCLPVNKAGDISSLLELLEG